MTTFANTTNPTPYGFFDLESSFQKEADAIVTFVKRKLGDDILSVELTKKADLGKPRRINLGVRIYFKSISG